MSRASNYKRYYRKNMSLKTPIETSADRTEQKAIIKFCIDLGKTPKKWNKWWRKQEKHIETDLQVTQAIFR